MSRRQLYAAPACLLLALACAAGAIVTVDPATATPLMAAAFCFTVAGLALAEGGRR